VGLVGESAGEGTGLRGEKARPLGLGLGSGLGKAGQAPGASSGAAQQQSATGAGVPK
jgi:hypothetical protein